MHRGVLNSLPTLLSRGKYQQDSVFKEQNLSCPAKLERTRSQTCGSSKARCEVGFHLAEVLTKAGQNHTE